MVFNHERDGVLRVVLRDDDAQGAQQSNVSLCSGSTNQGILENVIHKVFKEGKPILLISLFIVPPMQVVC